MKLVKTGILGAWVLESAAFEDNRGAFSRLFCAIELKEVIAARKIVQINHSMMCNVGSVKGLHYQNPPNVEMKIVRCIKGRVFDVVVDLRKDSPTFLQWHAVELTPENHLALVIPEGCAHGLQVLEADSELLYLHTAFYMPEAEGAVRYDEPRVSIKWPLVPTNLSARDLSHPYLNKDFEGIVL